MARADLRFSISEDVRILGDEDYSLEVFDAKGSVKIPTADDDEPGFRWIENQDLFVIEAGVLAVGWYSYAIKDEDEDEIVRIVRKGTLEIHTGAVKKSSDEIELEQLEAVLHGDDHDVLSIKLPDGRETAYESRGSMSRRANVLRGRIIADRRQGRFGIKRIT